MTLDRFKILLDTEYICWFNKILIA